MKSIIQNKISGILFFLITTLPISSCSENPVSQPPVENDIEILDSNFFDWEIYEDNNDNYSSSFFVADTNTVYFLGIWSLIRYKEGIKTSYSFNDASFQNDHIFGNSDNEIYISGIKFLSNTSYIPALKKFDGANFIDVPININRQSTITQVTFGNENDIWLPTDAYSVYRFQNGKTTEYRFDTGYLNLSLEMIDGIPTLLKQNAVQFDNNYNKYYKFINNKWVEYYISTLNEPQAITTYCGIFGGKYYSNSENNFIYKFTGENWIPFVNTKYNYYCHNLLIDKMGNVMLCGGYEYDYGRIIYISNTKVYRQTNYRNIMFPNVGGRNIKYKFDKYYILHEQRENFKSSFAIGTLKK
ncbi:MAG TPA: hypothetical protein PLG90_12645 [Ignavibacteria bacterium]|nr:hypothetical protein [Ignavibacteria bacterium]